MRRFLVGCLTALVCVVTAGCQEAPCGPGDGPMAGVNLRLDSLHSHCAPGDWREFSGEAQVLEIDRTFGYDDIFLWFTRDATRVTAEVRLPRDIEYPFHVGDLVQAHASVEQCPWWQDHALSVWTRSGMLLLSAYTGGKYLRELPEVCEEISCGRVGYPSIILRPPLSEADPTAPHVQLKQGEQMLFTHSGATYRTILGEAFNWLEFNCYGTPPQTQLSHVTILVAGPEH